jgi:NAD(P)-dependent dehydrogenase (short-subunit alcohol dehydrogenase family)
MGRDRTTLAPVAEALAAEHGIRAHVVRCDVSNEQSVGGAFREARREMGEPFVLVNNAGISEAAMVKDTTRELWDRVLAVNTTGAFLCIQQVLSGMLAARAGRIVNIASVAGLKAYRGVAAYITSKHALVGLTRALALETARDGLTVNAVCPGYTRTDMASVGVDNLVKNFGMTPEQALERIVNTMPRGRLVEPAEVAHAVAFLCSPEAAAITGQSIVVAGGEVM